MINSFDSILKDLNNSHTIIKKSLKIDKEIPFDKVVKFEIQTKSYVLLIHAELEKYFEVLAKFILEYIKSKYNVDGVIHSSLMHLAFQYSLKDEMLNASKISNFKKLYQKVGNVVYQHSEVIRKNCGIGESYISQLFLPLGIDEYFFTNEILMHISSLSSLRGGFAHAGSISKQTISINEEKNTVENLLLALGEFHHKVKLFLENDCLGVEVVAK
ncbi:MAG: HEPN domain-containing protein [bacterium]